MSIARLRPEVDSGYFSIDSCTGRALIGYVNTGVSRGQSYAIGT